MHEWTGRFGPRARAALLLAIPLFAIPLLFALPFFSGQVLLYRDLIHFHGPEGFLLAKSLREGHLPLWNPLFYGGTPFLAEPGTGVFYPPAWLFLALDPWRALTAFTLLHMPAAAFGAWLLSRRLGLGREASAIAATGYLCSGYLLSMNGGYFNFSVPALLPLAVAILLDAADRPSARRTALGAAAVAWLVFNGEQQGVFLAVLFAAALACVPPRSLAHQAISLHTEPISLAHKPSPIARRALGVGLAVALGAALGAVQLVPAILLARHSTRAHGLPLGEAQSWSLHPLRLLELFVPQPFGLSYPDNGFWGTALLDGGRRAPWAASLFLGTLLPIFALATPRAAWKGRTLALGAIAATALLLAFGGHTPLFAIFARAVPLADRFRYPERYAAAATLALVLLGAARIDALLRGANARVEAWLFAIGALIFGAAGALTLLDTELLARPMALGLHESGANLPLAAANQSLGLSLLEASLLCAAGLLALAIRKRERTAPLFFPLLSAMIALPMVANGFTLLSYGSDAALHGEPPLATAIREAIPSGSAGRFFAEGACAPEPGPEPLLERVRAAQYQMGHGNIFALFGLRNALGYGSLEDPDQIAWVQALNPLGDGVSARALGAAVRFGCRGGRPWLEAVDHPLARVRIAAAIAEPAALADAARALVAQAAGGDRTALVAPGDLARIPAAAAAGKAELREDRDEEISVHTSGGGGLLVLADRFLDGWSAAVDGSTAPVLRADHLWRAVPVPAGEHEVIFRYTAPGLLAGALISLLALVVCAGCLIWQRVTN